MNYNQHENIQTRKAISAYGGVGSILETRNGSILVLPFNEWPYFKNLSGRFGEEHEVRDKRFKNRLRRYFTELQYIIRIPINSIEAGHFSNHPANLLAAKYFPEWFYCNECHKFDHYSKWKKNWRLKVNPEDKEKFYPPKCYACYIKAQSANSKRKYFDLEQIRFILIAPDGSVADMPWERWALFRPKQKERRAENLNSDTDSEEVISLGNIEIPSDLKMDLKTLDKYSDLSGIGIFSKYDNDTKTTFTTLSGLFNIRIPKKELFVGNNEEILLKPVLRTSNSVYYPNILSSIYLPADDELNDHSISIIKSWHKKGLSPEMITQMLKDINISIEESVVQMLISNNFNLDNTVLYMTENEYRYDEYKYITSHDKIELKDDLIFGKISETFYPTAFLKSVYKMDKLRITSVQTSYTRQEPIDRDYYLRPDSDIQNTKEEIKKKYTSDGPDFGQRTKYLPAVENFGEGIFFDFDAQKIADWVSTNREVLSRITIVANNHLQSESSLNRDLKITPTLMLIHTFSHLIIKELEFLCGYPATSLQERLYVEEGKMQGVLIYTIAGAEGSYGGLTSLCKSNKIDRIIRSAMIRAKDCASDPICYHSTGQGVGNLNLSACYSCTLLPETSCEHFNCYLDRRLLIDNCYGFFKDSYF